MNVRIGLAAVLGGSVGLAVGYWPTAVAWPALDGLAFAAVSATWAISCAALAAVLAYSASRRN